MNTDSGSPTSAPLPDQPLMRRHERSWLVWLTLLPGLMVLFLVLGEFLVPH